MISKKDSKPFLVKFVIANTTDSAPKPIYGDWQVLSGLISDPKGIIVDNPYGLNQDYDRVIILNATETTRKIKEDTSFLINEYPTSNFEQGNYVVKRIFPEYNREIQIGLVKKEGIDIPEIYFVLNNNLVTYQLNYDKTTKKAYIDSNREIPFNSSSVIWTRKPKTLESTDNRIVFKLAQNKAVDSYHLYFTELTFEDYDA